MLPTKSATTTCEVVATSTEVCVTSYVPEIYYLDFMVTMAFVLFLLALSVVGLFLSQFHKT